MILLDTDTFSLLISGHPKVATRFAAAPDEVPGLQVENWVD